MAEPIDLSWVQPLVTSLLAQQQRLATIEARINRLTIYKDSHEQAK
jgi:hypothetical protein